MKTILKYVLICFFIWLFIALLPVLLAVALPLVAGIGIIGILLFLVFGSRKSSAFKATHNIENPPHPVGEGHATAENENTTQTNNNDSPEYIPGEKI
jgi:hypothetical protein